MEVFTIGRVLVDLYANELHRPLDEVETFSKYLGGSAGNMAVGLARLGHKTGLISKVGDDPHGVFLRRYLEESGVDTRFVGTDPKYRTALVFAALFPPADSRILFYRDPCADTEVRIEDVDVDVVADAELLVVTGTALARSPMRETVLHLMRERRRRGKRNVMDVDYRPVLWRDGSEMVLYYDLAVRMTDVLIGNELEIAFVREAVRAGGQGGDAVLERLRMPGAAGGTPEKHRFEREELVAAARDLVAEGVGVVVVKVGAAGSFAVTADGIYEAAGFPVDVVNTLGAGDGFAAGYCSGLLKGWDLERCLRRGNAVGAIVVSRHGCAPAIPTLDELEAFLAERAGGLDA